MLDAVTSSVDDPLLQPFQLKNLTLRNRVFSSAHEPAYADNGMPTDRYRLYHVEKAKGGLALTMTAGSAVVAESSPFSPGPEYRSLWSPNKPDVEQANALLDAIGLTKKDSEGFRLRTDNGERLILELPTIPAFIQFTQLAELVKEDWAAVGIFANVVEQERSQSLRQLRLADAGGAEEHERAHGAVRILQASAGAAHRS